MADEMRRNMGREGGGVVGKGGKGGKRNIYESAPPGAFPGIRTGQLRRSIMHTSATASRLVSSAGSASGKQDRYGDLATLISGPKDYAIMGVMR